jgi:hypothetical protein
MVNIVFDVLDIFQSDRESDEVFRDTGLLLLLTGQLLMGR